MDKKLKISSLLIWMMVLLLGLLGVICLMQLWMVHQGSVGVSSSTVVLSPEPISKEAESLSQVNRENNYAATVGIISKIANPEIIAPETVVTTNNPASIQGVSSIPVQSSDQAVPSVPAQSSESQVEQQEARAASTVSVNAPMTDRKILESIQQQNQRQQALQQVIANRDAIAAQVIRNAKITQGQSTSNQQLIPSDYSSPVAPADIRAKLKSNQLIAH